MGDVISRIALTLLDAPVLGTVVSLVASLLVVTVIRHVAGACRGLQVPARAVGMPADLADLQTMTVDDQARSLRPGNLRPAAQREGTLYFLAAGAVQGLALASLYAALGLGGVAMVSPLLGAIPLFAVAWSALLLRSLEHVGGLTVAGSLLIAAGVFVAMR